MSRTFYSNQIVLLENFNPKSEKVLFKNVDNYLKILFFTHGIDVAQLSVP